MTNTYCCVYSVETLDDGQRIGLKHIEFFTKLDLRNNASRWLLLYKYIMIQSPLNVKLRLYLQTDEELFLPHPYSINTHEFLTPCKLWT